MNDYSHNYRKLFDRFSIELQSIYKRPSEKEKAPLFNISCENEAAKAPFQYDSANAVLHRTGCKYIDGKYNLSIFALWEINEEDLAFACKKCKPHLTGGEGLEKDPVSDMMYGIFSLIDQFGSVLIERGKEYKKTGSGKKLAHSLGANLSEQQEKLLDKSISSLDLLINSLHQLNMQLESGEKRDKKEENHGNSESAR
ncbi:MAG: hypothetical protein OEV42_03910 [Deltaproteobacteria bacterium]|nr:hypothetical protein [Deltaproteobacteria bacterium]